MEGRGYGLIRALLWNLKGTGRKRLWPNTDIIVEFIRKGSGRKRLLPIMGIIVEYKRKWKEEVMAL